MKKNLKLNILLIIFLGLILIFSGCSQSQNSNSLNEKNLSEGELVVKTYYQSLNNRDYKKMYDLISDGFKEIDPYAKDLPTFENYMDKFFDTSSGVRVESVKEVSNKKNVFVDYKIVIISSVGVETPFESSFTMKKTDIGLKLIHPYGDNIDTSE